MSAIATLYLYNPPKQRQDLTHNAGRKTLVGDKHYTVVNVGYLARQSTIGDPWKCADLVHLNSRPRLRTESSCLGSCVQCLRWMLNIYAGFMFSYIYPRAGQIHFQIQSSRVLAWPGGVIAMPHQGIAHWQSMHGYEREFSVIIQSWLLLNFTHVYSINYLTPNLNTVATISWQGENIPSLESPL